MKPSAKQREREGLAFKAKPRILIVCDGYSWFVYSLRCIEHNLDRDEKVYYCDKHLSGPHDTLKDACAVARRKERK